MSQPTPSKAALDATAKIINYASNAATLAYDTKSMSVAVPFETRINEIARIIDKHYTALASEQKGLQQENKRLKELLQQSEECRKNNSDEWAYAQKALNISVAEQKGLREAAEQSAYFMRRVATTLGNDDGITRELVRLADRLETALAGEPVGGTICDGCNVREPWEHRCHGGSCKCPQCHTEPVGGKSINVSDASLKLQSEMDAGDVE